MAKSFYYLGGTFFFSIWGGNGFKLPPHLQLEITVSEHHHVETTFLALEHVYQI